MFSLSSCISMQPQDSLFRESCFFVFKNKGILSYPHLSIYTIDITYTFDNI